MQKQLNLEKWAVYALNPDASEYTLTATATTSTQDLQIANHGLDLQAMELNTNTVPTTSAPTGLTNNTNYFVRVINNSAIALYPNKSRCTSKYKQN